jgi:two-component system, OmpR family, response regulator ChvI
MAALEEVPLVQADRSPAMLLAKPASARRLAVVDDDDDFRRALTLQLESEGFEVVDCAGGRSALDLLATGKSVDVILLDWRMPEMNGLEVLHALRERDIATPVIFLTGLSDDLHEEAALTGGAVDYVEKSRLTKILLRRIELIAEGQRARSQKQNEIRLGALELRFDIGRAFWGGQAIDLTLTEFRMVSLLALKSGEDVSYRELYDLVHGKGFFAGFGDDGYRTNVRTFIKRIRQKFRKTDNSFASIENYGGFGYRWAAR